jgi:hypothetical protein
MLARMATSSTYVKIGQSGEWFGLQLVCNNQKLRLQPVPCFGFAQVKINRTSFTTKFSLPSSVVHRMSQNCMFVDKKCKRSNERMKILLVDRFVEKTRPVERLSNLDMVDCE